MLDMKDHGLRLFGKIIRLNSKNTNLDLRVDEEIKDYNECSSSNDNLEKCENRGHFEETLREGSKDKEPPRNKKTRNSTITEDARRAFNDNPCSSQDSHNKDTSDLTSSTNPNDQKPLKKPDKILPCPRCNSMTTKFCYFNNYNVNQPRHFCKDCQRYWTAGGTMRNVPVGAGRRKSKSYVASQHPHFLYPTASQTIQIVDNSPLYGGPVALDVPCFRGLLGYPVSYSDRSCMTYSSPSTSSSRKHSRDGTMLYFNHLNRVYKDVIWDNNSGNGRVVDDPIEASNSSIWNSMYIKNKCRVNPPTAKGGFFGGSQKINSNSSSNNNNSSGEPSSMVPGLNPAASSRSLSFHEIAQ
ncbi:hypothetical protein RND81_07G181700 [Saponaria officinalis]|uniref:Dof-type domain-containing protein n=1 Tax=Saponaria officinalis TaxID=3572 RepID=A0AAW1JTX2_SAPOF